MSRDRAGWGGAVSLDLRPDRGWLEAWQDGRVPRQREVDQWFARYENPMKAVVLRVREIVLGADPRIDECIKWQAPTFTFEGNLASFFPKSKQHASLMFHLGAQIPGRFPRLEGTGDVGRVMKISSVADAEAAREELEAIVRAWCTWRTGGAVAKKPLAAMRASATRVPAAKGASGNKARAARKAPANKVPARRAAPRAAAEKRSSPARAAKARAKPRR